MAAICVFCASSSTLDRKHLDLATAFGKALGPRGHSLVSGGGLVGMMGAVAEGARSAGAHTLGVIPQSLVDLEIADTASDELIVTTDMGARKNIMIERSDAFVILPGGLGTLDELFEVWTTATLDLHRKPIVVLDPEGFYTGLWTWLGEITETAFVRRPALAQVTLVTSIDAALDHIEQKLSGGQPRRLS